MSSYLKENWTYWQNPYEAENVESFVFRPFGRILNFEFGLDGSKHEKLLDFGCGSGAALRFFKAKGFQVYGVDISVDAIRRAKLLMPDISDHFRVIDPKPRSELQFFPELGPECFDVVTAIQSLYYLSNTDLTTCLSSLCLQMNPKAIIYATMMGTKCWYFEHSKPGHDGLRTVAINTARLKFGNYHVSFTHDEDDLAKKLWPFQRLHVGYYDAKYREDEGSDFHWAFVGRKTMQPKASSF